MKLVSYTLMACTLNKVLSTKISESPPLAPSLGTRTSLRSRPLELVDARKNEARVSPSRAPVLSFIQIPPSACYAGWTRTWYYRRQGQQAPWTSEVGLPSHNGRQCEAEALVKSQVKHATQVWSPNQYSLKSKIERVQKRATRIFKNVWLPVRPLLSNYWGQDYLVRKKIF